MTNFHNDSSRHQAEFSKARTLMVFGEVFMILAILLVWLLSEDVRRSRSLAVLFFYSFPSEFLVGLIPHEPILLYYGRYYAPWIVMIVAVTSTVLAEGINYTVFGLVSNTRLFRRLSGKRMVRAIVELFGKAPFTAIVVAGFTPVPFFPIRFLVVMGRYPVYKYLLGVFLSRAPRFYILAGAGYLFHIPGWALAVLFAVLIVTVNVPLVRKLLGRDESQE